ncbi:pentapeptide repeat-containing protein [Tenacibaculum finnmarkense genomovar ulcerans]|uniref:pentapeptide repeat-containing protein n=1 Tax=Tenacibaculum finnmarkense TaxID=2781243 RepID=UPI001E4DD22D|nr:pentapeptide repeat-containing protein [Tenacibaculum finnmarkense]MCD8455245.1 pentapeptide repeat-containing protein [Tenacibaculum finnmarkense genomovar ulcerans]
MEFKIDNSNYKSFLKNDKLIAIDKTFIKDNKIDAKASIIIEEIRDKNVMIYVIGIKMNDLNIEIKESTLYGIFFENAIINDLKLLYLEISEYKEAKFKTFKTYFDNSNIKSIWMHESKFFNGFLVRNESIVESIRINDSYIDHSFTHFDSSSSKLTVESSTIDDLSFQNNDIHKKGIKSTIDVINIFRTEIKIGFEISKIEFKELHLHKTNILKSTGLSDFKKDIFISLPDEYKEVEKIEFTECNIDRRLIITLNNLKELYSHDCSFQYFRINFWKIISFRFFNNTIFDNIFWGFQNHLKTIEKFAFNNCEVKGEFYLSDTHFKELLSIQGSSFNTNPSFFEHNTIYDTCKVDFEYSNLTNFVFQEVNFKNVSFKNIDIENAQFKDCEWELITKPFFNRYKVQNENKANNKTEDLLINKSIYSKLKSSFQKDNDYINSGRFYISEQESKKAISLKNKNYFEYILLSIHRNISSYGESVSKPLLLLLCLILISAFIYLFTGFNSGKRLIEYNLVFNFDNTSQTIKDFFQSVIFSLKNVVPFSVGNKFFLNGFGIKITEVLELIQKIFSLILLASFTESFVRYLKK